MAKFATHILFSLVCNSKFILHKMDSTLGSSFANNCNDSSLSLFDSTPRCMLFPVSDSFTLQNTDTSPPEPSSAPVEKASSSTPSFANDSYSDIIKVRPSKTYTTVEPATPSPSPSPSAKNSQSTNNSISKAPNRLLNLLPRKESPLVANSISTLHSGHKLVPSRISSSSSVSSLNSDDDLFFEQLATLDNSATGHSSPGPKISDFDTLLTGEVISHKHSLSSNSNSPLKDPTHQFCLSAYQRAEKSSSQPLSDCLADNKRVQKECNAELLKVSEETEKEKENVLVRGVASAIKPTQILPHWGGTGKQRTQSAHKRVTFENKIGEGGSKKPSDVKSDNHTPTRPLTRLRKIHSAPSIPSPTPADSTADFLTFNSRIWCPTACAHDSSYSPILHSKRVCRGKSTPPECPVSPAGALVLRSNSSPADTSLNYNISPGEELLGDNSASHLFPVIRGSNPDLKSIEPLTLVRILAGDFAEHISNLVIIDARYPYEYKAGHVKTAVNIWTEQLMHEFFLKSIYVPVSHLRHIVVFYCEFSTMRGPSQYRYLRNEDRKLNEHHFPKLHYPELYVLDGGYAHFFSLASADCDPCRYVKMLDEGYKEDLAKCQILKHQGSRRVLSGTCRVARPSKSKCRRKQKFQ